MNSTCRVIHVFSNFTPNTSLGGKKRVIGVEQSVPNKLCVIGVSGKTKSCLGLGYTEIWHHQISLEKFLMLPVGTLSFLFSVSQWKALKDVSSDI